MEVKEKILDIVSNALGMSAVTEDIIVLNTSGTLDENQTRELVMQIEEEFNVDISDEEAEKLTSVKSIIELVEKKIKK